MFTIYQLVIRMVIRISLAHPPYDKYVLILLMGMQRSLRITTDMSLAVQDGHPRDVNVVKKTRDVKKVEKIVSPFVQGGAQVYGRYLYTYYGL